MADMYIIGLQEMVDLTATNVALQTQCGKRAKEWCTMLESILNTSCTRDSYDYVGSRYLVGVLVCALIKRKYKPYLKDVQDATAAVGVMGVMGNKGGVSLRFQLFDSSFCFVCAHLAAHRGAVAQRNADFASIMAKTEFRDEARAEAAAAAGTTGGMYGVSDHDYVVFFGDFNYRIIETVSTEKCFELAYGGENELDILRRGDQLNLERAAGRSFHGFSEGLLSFRPTYKFQAGTSLYEQRPEKKLRAPAWCDRILWRVTSPNSTTPSTGNTNNTQFKQLYYGSVDTLLTSDHKPVHSLFEVAAKTTVIARRQAVIADITKQLDAMENRSLPRVAVSETSIHVPDLVYNMPFVRKFTVENTGQVAATWRFVPKPEEKIFCKTWLSIDPPYGMLPPGASTTVSVTFTVDDALARDISLGRELAMATFTVGGLGAHGAGNTSIGVSVNADAAGGLLEDILILRVERGRDFFLPVSAVVLPTAFGCSLAQLARRPEPMRAIALTTAATLAANANTGPFSTPSADGALKSGPNDLNAGSRMVTSGLASDDGDFFADLNSLHGSNNNNSSITNDPFTFNNGSNALASSSATTANSSLTSSDISRKGTPLLSIPKELWRLVDVLFNRALSSRGIFMAPGDPGDLILLREALDAGDPFPPGISMSTYAQCLIDLFTSLREPVIPVSFFPSIDTGKTNTSVDHWCTSTLRALSPLHYNVLVYIVRFGREILKNAVSNGVQLESLAIVFSRCLLRKIPHDEAPAHINNSLSSNDNLFGDTNALNGNSTATSLGSLNTMTGNHSTVSGNTGTSNSSTSTIGNSSSPVDEDAGEPAVSLLVGQYADKGTQWEPTREEQDTMTKVLRHFLTTCDLAPPI